MIALLNKKEYSQAVEIIVSALQTM